VSAPKDFVALILTHARADRVKTYDVLRNYGYTGPIRLVVDDQDPQLEEYRKRFPKEELVVFSKPEAAKLTDTMENRGGLRGVVYARNAAFDIARQEGFTYFIALDDDYSNVTYRFDRALRYHPKTVRNLDAAFSSLLRFFVVSGAASIAIAQGGDFIGGENNKKLAQRLVALRKAMNTFICSTERRFDFMGRINEDTNAYVHHGSKGLLFFTLNQLSITQTQTQQNPGGLTELYLDSGTYVKSFYTVMLHPSSVTVRILRDRIGSRYHHLVSWKHTVPKILRETLRKPAS
jgi:hypothetical protein